MFTKSLLFDGNVLHFRNINNHLMLHDVINVTPIESGKYLGAFEGMLIAVGYNKLVIHPKPKPLLTLQGFITESSVDFIITDHFGERFFVEGEQIFDCIIAIERMTLSPNQRPILTRKQELSLCKRVVNGKVRENNSMIMHVANSLKSMFWHLLNASHMANDTVPTKESYPMPKVDFSHYEQVQNARNERGRENRQALDRYK